MTAADGRQAPRGDGLAAVLLDLDGLLVDSEVLWSEADEVFLAARGVIPGDGLKSLVMGTTLLESARAMQAAYGLEGTPEEIARSRLELVAERYRARLEPRPGAAAALARLHGAGFSLALATASPRCLVAIVLERFVWADLFLAVVTGDDVGRGKPAPDLFLLAARRLGAAPRRCVVVEDAPAGIAAARAAGMRSVGVPDRRYHTPEELPADLVVDTLEALDPRQVRALLEP